MTIYVSSSNRGKLRDFEAAAMLIKTPPQISFAVLPGLDEIMPPDETGSTFQENAFLKALYYSQRTDELILADDSGLEVDALAGAPGVYSARFAGPHATSAENNRLLLGRLGANENRQARFRCVLALAQRGRAIKAVEGSVAGTILASPRGSGGFGYDPLFYYEPLKRTFGELPAAEKLAVSHRGDALRQLFEWLATKPDLERTTAGLFR